MDNSIIAILGCVAIAFILAIGAELFLSLVGFIIGIIAFFIPMGIILYLVKHIGGNDAVAIIMATLWIIPGCMILSSIFDK